MKEYEQLAKEVVQLSRRYDARLILHQYKEVAIHLGVYALHLPLYELRKLTDEERRRFKILGASCHSVEDAREAEMLGCTYITAGHIYATDCKKGLQPRGLDFLREICESVTIPVWGIGGITPSNLEDIISSGAAGGCIMSSAMQCEDFSSLIQHFQ